VQHLAQHTRMVVTVRNAGSKAIPNVAVTITSPPRGTSVQAFARYASMTGLASHSRPVWIIDRPPGPCVGTSGFSCRQGGAGGAVTAYSNTWAMGPLQPGQIARFVWGVTAVTTGSYPVRYQVAAGLNGKAKARLAGGGIPTGIFVVRISGRPPQSYVNNSGQIVTTSR
jgi:hypothetical protein